MQNSKGHGLRSATAWTFWGHASIFRKVMNSLGVSTLYIHTWALWDITLHWTASLPGGVQSAKL